MADNKSLNLINFFNNASLTQIQNREYSRQIMALNDVTAQNGLVLSEADAYDLVETRNKSLADNHRVEIGIGIVAKIIEKFCASTFIHQPNYAETLNELVEIFYYIKTEAKDKISDTDLLDLMWDYFENRSFGSMELMTGRELETLLKYIYEDRKDYSLDIDDDYNSFPEGYFEDEED
jgi:hypothetical protein